MRIAVVCSRKHAGALAERLALLEETRLVVSSELGDSPRAAAAGLRRLDADVLPYLIDINRFTAGVAAHLWRAGRSWVVDTGDDGPALARNRGESTARVAAYRATERFVVGKASAVVHRGTFHQPLLAARTTAPLRWVPDTVADSLLDAPLSPVDESVVATFGSTARPLTGDRVYGWEVVDLVAASSGQLRGIIVAAGPGRAALEHRARRLGVSSDVDIHPAMPLAQLVDSIGPAATVTSVQSPDLAGWVRTTAKLPLSLAIGKYVVATRVGEAVRVLPEAALVPVPCTDKELVGRMLTSVLDNPGSGWPAEARRRAQEFRRSTVAAGLAEFLRSVAQ